MTKSLAILVFCCIISSTFSANILYLSSVPSPSHFIWCSSLLKALAENGHNVTALSPDVEKSDKINYIHLEQIYPEMYNGTKDIDFFEIGKLPAIALIPIFVSMGETACAGAFKSKGYQQLLNYPNDFKVDLIISDITMGQCLTAFSDKFKNPPFVSMSAFNILSSFSVYNGGLSHSSFVPALGLTYSENMTFLQRLENTVMSVFEFYFINYYATWQINRMLKKQQPANSFASIGDTLRNSKLFLINSNPLMDYKEPVFSNVKLVGGMQIKKPKTLPSDLKKIIDPAVNGVVLFSLGSNVRSDKLGAERTAKLLNAFERLPQYTFLWKFEALTKLPVALPINVYIKNWMPQNDILAHPNTKLFISHCGLLSTQEAIWFKVPVLGFPIFADQPQNSLRLKNLGVGETLFIDNFTEDELYETIKKMLEDPSYKKKIDALSAAFRDKPQTALETATFWVEWLLRHPDIDTKSPTVNMGFMTRNSYDLIAFLTIVILIMIYLWIKIICKVVKCLKKPIDDNNKKNN